MLGSLSVENGPFNVDQLLQKQQRKVQKIIKQKLIPKGACQISQYNKYEYIKNFIMNSSFHMYIIPIHHSYAPFVIIKKYYPEQKYPIYQLYYHTTKAFLLAAQQQSMNIGCNYIISKQRKPQKKQGFIAKLRSNFARNEFNIFDNGNNPSKDKKNPRKQFAYIKNEDNVLWNATNKTKIIVPKARESLHYIDDIHTYQPLQFQCNSAINNPILHAFQSNASTIEKLQLKSFKQVQIKIKEVKSFVLEANSANPCLMINRQSQTYYQLEIGCPLTIVQGFGFLISLIESKSI